MELVRFSLFFSKKKEKNNGFPRIRCTESMSSIEMTTEKNEVLQHQPPAEDTRVLDPGSLKSN